MEVIRVDLVGCIFVSHENLCKVVFVNLRVGKDQNSCIKGKKVILSQVSPWASEQATTQLSVSWREPTGELDSLPFTSIRDVNKDQKLFQ